ncbi:MAG: hypothetical protein KTR20_07255 [Cellvibrionaceae bacterium]|nr:hypothetical protein [Cellvibrionaceae bacterium]
MIQLSDIEDTLTQKNHFCLLDWLLKKNHLSYADYEQWRYGKISTLDKQLTISSEALDDIIKNVDHLSQKLTLQQQAQEYYPWSQGKQHRLYASQHAARHQAITQQWVRPQDLPQMDLFMDNATVVAENKLRDNLCARQFEQAQAQLKTLTELNTTHEKLGHYQDLINYGCHMRDQQVAPEHAAMELAALEEEVLPLAKTLLQHQARDYLAFAWRRLAENLQHQRFKPSQKKLHASYALMQIPDWKAAINTLSQEKDQYQQTTLLLRTAQCHEALKNTNKALLCWCLLMERDEDACEAAIEAKTSTVIWPLWEDFWDENDDEHRSLFPAYLFIRQPGLIHHLHELPQLQAAATMAVVAGIKARLTKRDEMPARKKMQAISPSLLKLFLKQ